MPGPHEQAITYTRLRTAAHPNTDTLLLDTIMSGLSYVSAGKDSKHASRASHIVTHSCRWQCLLAESGPHADGYRPYLAVELRLHDTGACTFKTPIQKPLFAPRRTADVASSSLQPTTPTLLSSYRKHPCPAPKHLKHTALRPHASPPLIHPLL